MREPYQILLFLMATYFFMQIYRRSQFNLILFFKFMGSILILGLLHKGLMLFMLLILLIYFLHIFITHFNFTSLFLMLIVSLGLVFIVAQILSFTDISTSTTESLMDGNVFSYIDDYREGSINLDARAQYGVELNTNNLFTALYTFPFVFMSYMIAPLPWQ